ncbi:MAG: class I SAM-dependent methyltransferase [bacterium]
MTVSDEILVEIKRCYQRDYNGVNNLPLDKIANDFVSETRMKEQIDVLLRYVGDLEGKKILELGSGYGGFIVATRERGFDAYGLEPDKDCYEISLKLLKLNGFPEDIITLGKGENIPYSDESFDVIYSTQVLEHVQDPKKVLKEAIRVIKKGGYLQFVIPNYASFYEGHYGIFWIPYLPKVVAKLYVRLYGRNYSLIERLNFINLGWLKRCFKQFNNIEVLGWGIDLFEERMKSLEFSEWADLGKIKKWLKFLKKLGMLEGIRIISKWFGFYNPIILTIKKNG